MIVLVMYELDDRTAEEATSWCHEGEAADQLVSTAQWCDEAPLVWALSQERKGQVVEALDEFGEDGDERDN